MAKPSKPVSGNTASAPFKISAKALTPKLIATPAASPQVATVQINFVSGVGQVSVSQYRHGLQISLQATTGGTVQLADVQQGDVISVTGVGTGTTDITVSVPTTPATPDHFAGNVIMAGYLIN